MVDPIHLQGMQSGAAASEPLSTARTGQPTAADGSSFAEMLAKNQSVRFSNHAQKRLQTRSIDLNEDSVNRLSNAVDKAEQRGGKSSLVLVDNLAFIVNVQERLVVTAMNTREGGEGVFTHIDTVVLADPGSNPSGTDLNI
jgi:flagellar operon protein